MLRQLRQGPQPAGRLGHAVGLSPTTITRVLDRLEAKALVFRRRDREDRRCVDIHLAPQGQQLLGGVKVIRGSDLHRAVESMTSQERHKFRHTYATRHLQDGIDIPTLQQWMGHPGVASTMVYLKGVRNSNSGAVEYREVWHSCLRGSQTDSTHGCPILFGPAYEFPVPEAVSEANAGAALPLS